MDTREAGYSFDSPFVVVSSGKTTTNADLNESALARIIIRWIPNWLLCTPERQQRIGKKVAECGMQGFG
jgi:hypothetical protein